MSLPDPGPLGWREVMADRCGCGCGEPRPPLARHASRRPIYRPGHERRGHEQRGLRARARIVVAIWCGDSTVDEIAARLGITPRAVRVQLARAIEIGTVHRLGRGRYAAWRAAPW